MFGKVLVANRGEIAVRAFRAAYELGEPGHPVRAYLDVAGIVGVAKRSGAEAIYPGYGFLSENPALAEACERAGIAFVGPPARVLHLAGNKARAVAGDAGGAERVRRPDGVSRTGRGGSTPHRGAGAGRRRGRGRPPVRAGLLGAASASEGGRAGARAEPRTRPAAAD